MCGISGIYAFNEIGRFNLINLQKSIDVVQHRGPDGQGSYFDNRVGLGHRRLSVIDLSEQASQPMHDISKRYWMVFNGEIYNYRTLKNDLIREGFIFQTESDTEVLLHAFIRYKEKCLDLINGDFSFAIYDQHEEYLFLARDRFGIKPLLYYEDEDKFLFASELRSLLAFGIEKLIDYQALHLYLQLNYVPAPLTMIKNVKKLLPGHFLKVRKNQIQISKYYSLPSVISPEANPAQPTPILLRKLLKESVEKRLISDVPLGTFLSGGIDSSIITAIASEISSGISSFSIGYKDEPFFDETEFAEITARHLNTQHTTFRLSNIDLFSNLYSFLDHLDEPFADSSALPVYILSKETRKQVTVALSGDGADELFGGYNKHQAFFRAGHPGLTEWLVYALRPLWFLLPKSRNNSFGNLFRQAQKFCEIFTLDEKDQYWKLAILNSPRLVNKMISPKSRSEIDFPGLTYFQQDILKSIKKGSEINDFLSLDIRFVLPNDMLFKVDQMSMASGLEVRVPFLDHQVVEFVNALHGQMKINRQGRKILLKETFAGLLPEKILARKKKGFEVPLLKWMKTELNPLIHNELLNEGFLAEQGIFNPQQIRNYKRRLFSPNPGDVHAHLWALIVFQWWWKKYFT